MRCTNAAQKPCLYRIQLTQARVPCTQERLSQDCAFCSSSPAPRQGLNYRQIQCQAEEKEPWYIGFQMNERYLQWGESGQARFLKIHCAKELGWSQERVEDELNGLMALLPGLQFRFERMKADLVIKLVTQRQRVAECLVALRAALPSANIASIATTLPSLLTTQTPEELSASVQSIRDALPNVPDSAIDGMVEAEPRILNCDIPLLLSEIERLLPGQDPRRLLLENPSSYMDMPSQGLHPSLEDEPGLQ